MYLVLRKPGKQNTRGEGKKKKHVRTFVHAGNNTNVCQLPLSLPLAALRTNNTYERTYV